MILRLFLGSTDTEASQACFRLLHDDDDDDDDDVPFGVYMRHVGTTERIKVYLISCEIILQQFQPM